jgi:hypothetical protein
MHFKLKSENIQLVGFSLCDTFINFYHDLTLTRVQGRDSCQVIKLFVKCVVVVTENINIVIVTPMGMIDVKKTFLCIL